MLALNREKAPTPTSSTAEPTPTFNSKVRMTKETGEVGADTEEQHYECSDDVGQDWLGNVVGDLEKPKVDHSDVGQGSPSNHACETCPQSELCSRTTMVVDKSKNRKGERTQGAAM